MPSFKSTRFHHSKSEYLPYLADTPRGIHGSSKGQEGVSFQQHTAHTGLIGGNQNLSICKASLEDQFGIWK